MDPTTFSTTDATIDHDLLVLDSPFIHVERAQDRYKEWMTYTTKKRNLWEIDRESHCVLVHLPEESNFKRSLV